MSIFKHASRQRMAGVMYRQLILYWRHLDRKFEICLWPALDAVMFGAIGTYAQKNGGGDSSLAILLSGLVMAQIVWQSHIHLSKFFLQETWDWNVLYLMTRPLRPIETVVAAVGLAGAITSVAIAFIAVAVAVSFGLNLTSIPLRVLVLFPILMVMGWSTALLATSLVIWLGQKADNFVWAVSGLMGALAGAFVPVENLPPVLREISLGIPMMHAYEAGRTIMFGNTFPAKELALAAAGALVMAALAVYALSKSMSAFRNRGYISRYV